MTFWNIIFTWFLQFVNDAGPWCLDCDRACFKVFWSHRSGIPRDSWRWGDKFNRCPAGAISRISAVRGSRTNHQHWLLADKHGSLSKNILHQCQWEPRRIFWRRGKMNLTFTVNCLLALRCSGPFPVVSTSGFFLYSVLFSSQMSLFLGIQLFSFLL